jgi:hypothetical protein
MSGICHSQFRGPAGSGMQRQRPVERHSENRQSQALAASKGHIRIPFPFEAILPSARTREQR